MWVGSPTAVGRRGVFPALQDRLRHQREEYYWQHLQVHDVLSAASDIENNLIFSQKFFLLANMMFFVFFFSYKCAQNKKKRKNMRYKFLNYLANLVYGNHGSVWSVDIFTGYTLVGEGNHY